MCGVLVDPFTIDVFGMESAIKQGGFIKIQECQKETDIVGNWGIEIKKSALHTKRDKSGWTIYTRWKEFQKARQKVKFEVNFSDEMRDESGMSHGAEVEEKSYTLPPTHGQIG